MRNLPAVFVLLCLVSTPLSLSARQTHQTPTHQHAGSVMGFDQDRTTHHFWLFPDGGAIDVGVTDVADAKNRDAIRSHLSHIAMMFGSGDFTAPMLVHDSSSVPGTKIMTERKAAIRFQYVETLNGGRVNIVTTDAAALAGVHEFLKYQIAEHKTGDPTTVRMR
jgi:hypothetical protein